MREIRKIAAPVFMKLLFGVIIWLVCLMPGFSKTAKIDSLLQKLEASKDSVKAEVLSELCWEYKFSDFSKALQFCKEAIEISEKIDYEKGMATAYNNIAVVYANRAEFENAIDFFLRSLKLREKMAEKSGHSINDKKGISYTLNNLGNIYRMQGNHETAIQYMNRSLAIKKELNDRGGIAQSYINIGSLYNSMNQYDSAIYFFSQALQLHDENGNKNGMGHALNNIALAYQNKKEFEKAMLFYKQSLKVKEDSGEDKMGIANTWNNMAAIYVEQKKSFDKVIEYSKKALLVAEELGAKNLMKHCLHNLSVAYHALGEYNTAFEHLLRFSNIKDSILNEENSKAIAEMSAKYESDKKEKEIEILKHKEEIQELALSKKESELNKQKMVIWSAGIGLLIVISLSFFIFKEYRAKKKANMELEQRNLDIIRQKEIIEEQKKIVDEKNKDVLDSIRYAKRIQTALLPQEEYVSKHLPEHFILYKPKDIVAGDFYWAYQTGLHSPNQNMSKKLLIAAADCTGHGVPGAFMSMLGTALLNEVMNNDENLSPAEILNQLRENVIKSLHQTGKQGESKDGMDIALCALNLNGAENYHLQFSGANNPLWLYRNSAGKMEEFSGDKQPIGYFLEDSKPFTNHSINVNKGDVFYIFTDGYADQFGGPKGKKFKYKQLQEVLHSIHKKTMDEQKIILNNTIESWKGNLEQIDDICIIGMKV